jgi:ABC-type Na+ efflux pump permease subunit
LLLSIAYVAAGSFRRERETGALELILVTPLSERQIISGRLRGIWNQFLPTFGIWVAVILYLASALKNWPVTDIARFTVAYLAVPVVGLYFSLRSRFVLLAWLATVATCYLLPQLVLRVYFLLLDRFAGPVSVFGSLHSEGTMTTVMVSALIAVAVFLRWRLQVNLRRRSFSFR